MRFSYRPVENTGLLKMAKWMVEIATSSNQSGVGIGGAQLIRPDLQNPIL